MSFLGGGFGLSASSSSSATAGDEGPSYQQTPVIVIAGNSGSDPVALVNAAAQLSLMQNQPAELALGQGSPALFNSDASTGGGIPTWMWLGVAAVIAWKLFRG